MLSAETKAILADTRPLSLDLSPYTYVRVTVMGSELIREEQYRRLTRLSVPEIIQFLEESGYKREIDELATGESGVQLIEHAVARNFWRTVEKLRRISDERMRFFIDVYVWRNDIQNLKTLLRAKRAGEPVDAIRNLFLPGTIEKEELIRLAEYPTAEAILDAVDLPFLPDAATRAGLDDPATLETALTHGYYRLTHQIARRIRSPEDRFRQFLLLEIDLLNVLTLLKLKAKDTPADTIEGYLIDPYEGLPRDTYTARHLTRRRLFRMLIDAPDLERCFALLTASRFGPIVADGITQYRKTRSLLDLERDIQTTILRRAASMTHREPLTADAVISFLFAKVIETRNILILAKGKSLGLADRFLEEELVIR